MITSLVVWARKKNRNLKIICSCMNSKRRQRNNGESADRHQIENTEARKKTGKEIWTLMCCALFSVSSCFLQGVQVESGREGGDPQLRHGSCQEIHKERGR